MKGGDYVFERVTDMLEAMGVQYIDEDYDYIMDCIEYAKNYIKDYCNLDRLPAPLFACCARLAAGKYLKKKLAMGELEDFDFDVAVSSLKEGDVTISYSDTDKSNREIFVDILEDMTEVDEKIIKYRRLSW
jgi:hypothetical protein